MRIKLSICLAVCLLILGASYALADEMLNDHSRKRGVTVKNVVLTSEWVAVGLSP